MSVKISGQVWELDLEPVDKLVLLALADHADHEGNNVRPGNDMLCAKTGLSQPTVSARFKKFVELGILTPTNTFGRGQKREFSINLEPAKRHQYFIEKDARKAKARHTFNEQERQKLAIPLETERYKLTDEKVKADNEKVKADAISHDKECARVEPSEPSIEPSINPSERKAARKPDALFEIFAEKFLQTNPIPYLSKTADFVQLTALRKKSLAANWELTETRFALAVDHYFASEIGQFTLADLSVRFSAFYKSPLDRFGQPIKNGSNGNGKTYESAADRSNRYIRETLEQCFGAGGNDSPASAVDSEITICLQPTGD